MDFSKFRESGELSDIVITVDDVEFKLHKFPLYAKSDYFRNLSRQAISKEKSVILENFPGGAEIFSLVADFCYNMVLPLTKSNIVQIRCAASQLEMDGQGNLADIADKFLQDTITSAKMSRSIQSIVTLLINCGKTGDLAEEAGIVTLCVDALIDCWLKPPTKFSSLASKDQLEEKTTNGLCSLPVEWFVKILVRAQDEGVRMSELATLAIQYVSKAMEDDTIALNNETSVKNDVVQSKSMDRQTVKDKEVKIAKILDSVLLALPEGSYTLPYITPDWLTKVLKIATTHGCECRHLLIKAASEMLSTLSAEDLCSISPAVIHDIVTQASGDEKKSDEAACKLVDTYTSEMAQKGILTAETFKLLMSAAPSEGRTDHNKVYDVLEYVLKSDKDGLNEEQRKELINLVDFTHLNETTLQKAYESDLVPKDNIAKGSLALCHQLRSELDKFKYRTIVNGESPTRQLRDSIKGAIETRESINADTSGEEAIKAATDVLMAARTKLLGPELSKYRRQYYTHPSGASHIPSVNPLNSSLDDDTSFEEDYDYRPYERSYRTGNADVRSRPRYTYSNHSTYFPYNSRY